MFIFCPHTKAQTEIQTRLGAVDGEPVHCMQRMDCWIFQNVQGNSLFFPLLYPGKMDVSSTSCRLPLSSLTLHAHS